MFKDAEIMGGKELCITGGIFILGVIFGLSYKEGPNPLFIAITNTIAFFGAIALYMWLIYRINRKVVVKEKDLIKRMAYEFGRQDKEQELKELYGDTNNSGVLS